jgi:hypothetical protein
MTDDDLERLLRAAVPPVETSGPRSDLWPALGRRLDAPPQWAWIDLGLAAAVVAALVMFPDWVSLLVYHF